MSRSYRKPYVKDGYKKVSKTKQFYKRYSNKIIRHADLDELANGGYYKKFSKQSWNICDYQWYVQKPLEDRVRYMWSGRIVFETLEEQLKTYNKLRRK